MTPPFFRVQVWRHLPFPAPVEILARMPKQRNWTWDETLVAFRLYCRTPFGRLHQHNPEIVALAGKIGRTPSAVGMKACNFASLDPVQQARGVRGLPNSGRLEKVVWERFNTDSEAIASDAERAYEQLTGQAEPAAPEKSHRPTGPTDTEQVVRVRRVQSFFRNAVLASYDGRCAITGLAIPSLLNASHIVPWSKDVARRADPTNGICLNALHDRAFDRGLITFDDEFRLVVASNIESAGDSGSLRPMLDGLAGHKLSMPARFAPSLDAISFHRTHVFAG